MTPTTPDPIKDKLADSKWYVISKQENKETGWESITSAQRIPGWGIIHRISTRQTTKSDPGLPNATYVSVSEATTKIKGASIRTSNGINEIVF